MEDTTIKNYFIDESNTFEGRRQIAQHLNINYAPFPNNIEIFSIIKYLSTPSFKYTFDFFLKL